jgi:uncharacterized protein (DUF1697 family)
LQPAAAGVTMSLSRPDHMPKFVAFLRALNVGGNHVVTMEALRGHFEALGFKSVETFIASGNVIFTSPAKDFAVLQKKIEHRLRTSLGYEVSVFIRTETEVAAIARYQPFKQSQLRSAVALNVGFLAEPPGKATTMALMALKSEIDDFHVHGREVYWLCREKQSESAFSNALLEKTLNVRATIRGANTVSRLAARHCL